MPEEIDLSMLTIEHILPQSKGEETEDAYDVGAIGNLFLVNETINGKLDNKDFSEKKKILQQDKSIYIDDQLRNAAKWTQESIANRGVTLAEIGFSKIWKI